MLLLHGILTARRARQEEKLAGEFRVYTVIAGEDLLFEEARRYHGKMLDNWMKYSLL